MAPIAALWPFSSLKCQPGATDFTTCISDPLNFTVIGSDQGLASAPTDVTTLLSEPGSRYDIIVDFKTITPGNRVIMKNIGGDEPFGGDIPGAAGFWRNRPHYGL